MPDMLRNSSARINYAFVPATLPVPPAIVGPGKVLLLSHIQPIPSGINATLRIRWRATSPILCGNEGETSEYSYTDNNGRRQKTKVKLTIPLKNGAEGRETLSGTALAGMIRNVLKAVTGSYYGPINKKYINRFGSRLARGEHPITSADINEENSEIGKALRILQNRQASGEEKRTAKETIATERTKTLNGMRTDNSDWSTIADVADRTYCPDATNNVLDWTNAMMGFVLGENENAERSNDQWRPEWPAGLGDAFPQGIQSRISFSFADCLTVAPGLWPNRVETVLKVPGASPKVSFNPSYLAEGAWNTGDSRLAGLKIYPVHDPDLGAFSENAAFFENYTSYDRDSTTNPPVASDTLLRFIMASDEAPIEFEGTIACHNLAPAEFGALIWALFVGEPVSVTAHDDLRHNIGHLRGFGMGQLAPMLVDANLSINPNPEAGKRRQELSGELAYKKMDDLRQDFEKTDTGKLTAPARERLKLFRSRRFGNRLKDHGRIKSYVASTGRDALKFTELKGRDFSISKEDDAIIESLE
ncbi:hypothetical protein [Sedimentitalea todarodis]|uniref:Uncharacterized protein n=1 Tax=Sedimentitalea todarodis TaxID=1631240 RepID=A0ABU3VE62_9RHOB|nr:hypothetical protein [Sedimentitalea todarodis]MDU9004478.1 hypothetical protein [Sedimentitalea todarodis]